MKLKLINRIDLKPTVKKLESDELWLYAAQEWKRIISPYVPRRTGQLMQNVQVKPNEIIYKSPYAAYLYGGKLYVDPKLGVGGFTKDGIKWWSRPRVKKIPSSKNLNIRRDVNPKASREWDKAAIKDKQDELLAKSIQKWIDKNL